MRMCGKMGVWRLLICLFPFVCSGEDEVGTEACVSGKFCQLERDIPSLYLINGLHLSKEQAGELAKLLEDATVIEDKIAKKEERALRKRKRDFSREVNAIVDAASRGRDMKRRGVGRSFRARRVRRTRNELRELRGSRHRQLSELADEVFALLTESQRKIVDSFVPCFIPPHDFRNPERVGQATGDTSFVEEALRRLRRQRNDGQMTVAMDRALDRLTPYAMKKRHVKYSEEAEQEIRDEIESNLAQQLPKIQKMSEADFEIEKGNLAAEIVPMRKNDSPSARQWKIRRYILNTGVQDVIQARAQGDKPSEFWIAQAGAGNTRNREVACATRAAVKAVRTAVLLKDLNLTSEQKEAALKIIRTAVDAKQKIDREIEQARKAAIDPYVVLRGDLASGQPTRPGERGANRAHYGVKQLHDNKLRNALLEQEACLDRTLSATQVAFLSGGAEERGGRDGGREIGRVMNRAKRALSEARRLSSIAFKREKDAMLGSFIRECMALQGLSRESVAIEAEVKRASSVLEKARKMKSAEYAATRDELAAELCPRRKGPRPPTYSAKYVAGKPVAMLSSSSNLLFSETACRILEGKRR